jgi:hypothetical protein
MIDRTQMMEPMLRACPSFQGAWDKFLADWKDSGKDLPYYLALSDLARHLVAMLEQGDTRSFEKIFDIIERWHTEGDDYVREAATVGLLEDLQNANLYSSGSPEGFRPYLRAHSLRWWEKVQRFWQTGEVIRDN